MAAATKPLAKVNDLVLKLAEALGLEEGQQATFTVTSTALLNLNVRATGLLVDPFGEVYEEPDDDVVDDDDDDDDVDDDDVDDDDVDDDVVDDDDDDDADDDDDDDDDEEEWDEDRLRALKLPELRKVAEDEFGVENVSKLKTKDAVIDAIFEAAESGDDDDEPENF